MRSTMSHVVDYYARFCQKSKRDRRHCRIDMLRAKNSVFLLRIFNQSCKRWISKNSGAQKLKKSYCFQPSQIPLLDLTIGEALDLVADECGDDLAFVFQEQGIRCTYEKLKRETNQLAAGLIAIGLQKGDRIAIWAPNVYEWVLTQYACAKAGLILVQLNPALQASEVEYCINKTGCKAIIASETFKTQNYYEILCTLVPQIKNLKAGLLSSSKVPTLEKIIVITENSLPGTYTFESVCNAGDSGSQSILSEIGKKLQFDEPAAILLTSGTTGQPKGACLSHFNLINNAMFLGRRMNYHQMKLQICCQVPLFHCYGSVAGSLASVFYRGTSVFPSTGFLPKSSLNSIEEEKCNVLYGTPTMHIDLLNLLSKEKCDISSLSMVVTGGAVCSPELIQQIKNVLKAKSIFNAYGLTETSPVISILQHGYPPEKQHTVGKPIDHVEVKIVDSAMNIVPPNTIGEFQARGHNIFLGYWNDSIKTKEVVDCGRWLHTGDLAVMDDDGYISIVGRLKDMVIRGGENIYPAEIEDFLLSHPDILEAEIVGVPDARMGEELCAWIRVIQGKKLTESEVKDYCKGKISHFKIPKYVIFVDDLPKTLSGKVQKFKIREDSLKLLQL